MHQRVSMRRGVRKLYLSFGLQQIERNFQVSASWATDTHHPERVLQSDGNLLDVLDRSRPTCQGLHRAKLILRSMQLAAKLVLRGSRQARADYQQRDRVSVCTG